MKTSHIFLLLVLVFLSACKDKDDNSKDALIGKWEIQEFMSVESVLYMKDDDFSPVIEFKNDGTYELQLDVNECSGNFDYGENETIGISEVGCTYVCCDSDFSEKATAMLFQVESFTVQQDELELHVPGWGWLVLKKVSN